MTDVTPAIELLDTEAGELLKLVLSLEDQIVESDNEEHSWRIRGNNLRKRHGELAERVTAIRLAARILKEAP